jgi:AmiR/NasT family two-component response regulator
LAGWQNIQRAKSILMNAQGLTEEEAHQTIRRKAMSKRVPIEEMALAIINANELLNSMPKVS